MNSTGDFQDRVRQTIGKDFNFQIDRPHDGKPKHIDLTARIPRLGADKVEVDFQGNVLGGTTQIGKKNIKW